MCTQFKKFNKKKTLIFLTKKKLILKMNNLIQAIPIEKLQSLLSIKLDINQILKLTGLTVFGLTILYCG